MKHTLKLRTVDDSQVAFSAIHKLAEPGDRKEVGTEPYGPFYVRLAATMHREDWDAAGNPVKLEMEL